MPKGLESLPPCAHFISHKKSLHLSRFLFSFVQDCDRMGRDRFSPVKRMTLLLLLVMPSTRELIPCSYTVLPTQRSWSSPGLQPKRSECPAEICLSGQL